MTTMTSMLTMSTMSTFDLWKQGGGKHKRLHYIDRTIFSEIEDQQDFVPPPLNHDQHVEDVHHVHH